MTLASFNASSPDEAVAVMLSCCASRRFAATMADGRPYSSVAAAQLAVSRAFDSLTWDDVLEAISAHPRIGDRTAGQSAAEQAGVAEGSRAGLADGNTRYEARFGHVFLICAAGLTGEQMRGALEERLENDPYTERKVATAELEKITLLRVRKALGA